MKNRIILIFLATIFVLSTKVKAQNGCVEIETILVAACLSPTSNSEGYNEIITLRTGSTALNVNDLAVNWSSGQNAWAGAIQNSVTAAKVAEINATIVACGLLVEPVNGVIPPNSRVIVFSSYLVGATNNSFANVSDTLIAVFQNDTYTAGHFLNYVATQVFGYLQTTNVVFNNPSGCFDDATYNRNLLVLTDGTIGNQPGASVTFTADGTPTYFNNGCLAPIDPISASWTPPQTICQLDAPINLNELITGTRGGVWTGSTGITDSIFNPAGLTGQITITYTVTPPVTCATLPPISESHPINIIPLGNASWVGPDTVCSADLLINLTPYVTGQPNGTWTGTGVSGNNWNVVALSGPIQLTYSVGQGSCLDQVTNPIEVISLDPLVLTGTNQYCDGVPVLPITTTGTGQAVITWYSDPALTVQVGTGPSFTPPNSSSATYYAIQSFGSCSSLPASFEISSVSVSIPEGDTLVNYCDGSQIPQLSVIASHTVLWYSDSTLTNQVSTGNTYTPVAPQGTFWVISKIGDCSSDPLVIELVEDTVPTVSITVIGGNSLCFSDSIVLSSASPTGNVWSNNETTQSIVVTQPGIYSLTRGNGCDTVTAQESIVGLPVFADFTVNADTGLAIFELIIADSSQNADQCSWFLDDSLLIDNGSLSNLLFPKKGEYDLTHICSNSEGCKDTVTLTIVVIDPELELTVPNVFSPNADLVNDQFRVKYNAVKTFQAIVYNRWGKKLYEWTDVSAGWDGTFNGNDVPEGVYFYVITVTDFKDKAFDKKGSVQLIRN